ncbi:DUF1801 domain-containing protein [Yoonia sp. 208BN28-4]|uniref:DUF1801 domain-containing protein n=1 Tax=Yoonia sp. 208BN28-4 TaxID=3126505 RepID=UPI0030AAC5C6
MPVDTIEAYNAAQEPSDRAICERIMALIGAHLAGAERKMWHAHPVWFLDGNPIVGYGKLKSCVRLMFWSGQTFDAAGLTPTGTFKAAEKRYTDADQIDANELKAWLADGARIQWDYKNIYKRKGRLERLV